MSNASVIGGVTASLRELLSNHPDLDSVKVTALAPDESGATPSVNLFLYKIQENTTLKNINWQPKPGDPDQLTPPPLSLNLFYLVTAYAQNDDQDGNANAHQHLGGAMRAFFENPILPGSNQREQIKIMLTPMDMDELTKIWSTFSKPFRLSVVYEVSVVQLDKSETYGRPIAKRVGSFGIETRAPYKPPVVETMTPIKGTADTTLVFHGRHLAGWHAYVTVMGTRFPVEADGDDGKLSGDQFHIELPDDLPPGFHEIQVDIAGLFRKTFFFEITENDGID